MPPPAVAQRRLGPHLRRAAGDARGLGPVRGVVGEGAVERRGAGRVAGGPRVDALLIAAGPGVVPLGLARQEPAVPDAERVGLVPVDAVDGVVVVRACARRPGAVGRVAGEVLRPVARARRQVRVPRRAPPGLVPAVQPPAAQEGVLARAGGRDPARDLGVDERAEAGDRHLVLVEREVADGGGEVLARAVRGDAVVAPVEASACDGEARAAALGAAPAGGEAGPGRGAGGAGRDGRASAVGRRCARRGAAAGAAGRKEAREQGGRRRGRKPGESHAATLTEAAAGAMERPDAFPGREIAIGERGDAIRRRGEAIMPRGIAIPPPEMAITRRGIAFPPPEMAITPRGNAFPPPEMAITRRGNAFPPPEMAITRRGIAFPPGGIAIPRLADANARPSVPVAHAKTVSA